MFEFSIGRRKLTVERLETTQAEVPIRASEIAQSYGLDLVTAEAIHTRLVAVTQQMFANVMRSAFSMVARDQVDMGVSINLVTDAGTEACAIAAGCLQHAPVTNLTCNMVLEEWGYENLNPGDVLICNDPYRGAIHQADVNLFRPVFVDGELVFVLHALSHLIDLGGMYPGTFWMDATDYYQEGLLLPPILLYSQDVPVRSTHNLILENTRTPLQNLGDLRALYGSLAKGEALLGEVISKYGIDAVRNAAQYAMDYTEQSMRSALQRVPDGDYVQEETLDGDAVGQTPIRLRMTILKRGDSAEIDWSGTERQCLGASKTALVENCRPLLGLKVVLDPESPLNGGMMRPFDFLAPRGSMVAALPPASVSDHPTLGGRSPGMAAAAIGQSDPDIAMGMDSSSFSVPTFTGLDNRPGHKNAPWVVMLHGGGAWGGTSSCDGNSFCTSFIGGNQKSSVFEHVEQESPVRVWGWESLPDSGGPGKYRGGLASILMVEPLVDESRLTMFGERSTEPPPGISGGGPSVTAHIFFVDKDERGAIPGHNGMARPEYIKPIAGLYDEMGRPDPGGTMERSALTNLKPSNYPIGPGTVVATTTVGAGGWGDPLERSVEDVAYDVRNEYVTVDGAREYYGVFIDPVTLVVDEEATKELREQLARQRTDGTWSLPPTRYLGWPAPDANQQIREPA